ncbi:MAG: hypothetical protein ACJAZ1_003289, partial [Yoonia sp.]
CTGALQLENVFGVDFIWAEADQKERVAA